MIHLKIKQKLPLSEQKKLDKLLFFCKKKVHNKQLKQNSKRIVLTDLCERTHVFLQLIC